MLTDIQTVDSNAAFDRVYVKLGDGNDMYNDSVTDGIVTIITSKIHKYCTIEYQL